MRRAKWHQNYWIWKLFWVIETKTLNQSFRFNNPKQFSNWIILVSFCSSHLAIKNCYNVHFMKIEKIDAKIDFSAKNSKKFVYYNENMSNFKRNYLKNYNDSEHAVKTKNAPFFMIFPNISFFHMIVNYWTGPLKGVTITA